MVKENKYIGHPSQLIRLNDYRICGGMGDGVRAVDVANREIGLTVLADRGMDFPYFSYHGINMGYIAPCGIVSPQYYDSKGNGFLKGFNAGFLTTCGLTNMGATCDYEGVHYGMHGSVSYSQAEYFSAGLKSDTAVISGEMRQGALFGDNLVMRREVECEYNQKGFSFTDTVTNEGFKRSRHMLLYHFNLGFPFLEEGVELLIPHHFVEARDDIAKSGFEEKAEIPPPIHGYKEMCYFYKLKLRNDNTAVVGAYNHRLGFGVSIEFDGGLLDSFTQWKMVGEGEYTIGFEPGNATPLGVAREEELGHVKYLEAGETRTYSFKINIFDDVDIWRNKICPQA